MSKPHFMIDIETTGLEPESDEIMQVAIVVVWKDHHTGFWNPGGDPDQSCPSSSQFKLYQRIKHTTYPHDEFAKEHMVAMYDKCRALTNEIPPTEVREKILTFFRYAGAEHPAPLMGWNPGILDIPFLVAHKYLFKGDNAYQGDFHHRLYDIRSACKFQADLTGIDEKVMREVAYAAYPELETPLGVGKHDALYDCYRQIRILNGLIRLAKR